MDCTYQQLFFGIYTWLTNPQVSFHETVARTLYSMPLHTSHALPAIIPFKISICSFTALLLVPPFEFFSSTLR